MNVPKLKIIIVDDDANARDLLNIMIKNWANNDIEYCGEAENVPEAVLLIRKVHPDLVFLDIEMPGLSGLQLLDFFNIEEINFKIVFCTAYSEYALHAFKMSAVDYILKPIQWDDVERAITKTMDIWTKKQLLNLRDNLKVERKQQRIALPTFDGYFFLPISKIVRIEAAGSYSEVYDTSGNKVTASKKMKEFEDLLLEDARFLRPHRSHIVNMDFVQRLVRQDGAYLVLDNGVNVPIAREFKDKILELMSSF